MHEVCEVSEFVEKAAQTLLSSFWNLHLRKLMELTRSSTLYLLHFFKLCLLSLLSGSQISSVFFNTHTLSESPFFFPACFFPSLVLLLVLRWLTVEEWFNQGECLFLLFLCLSVSLSTHLHKIPPSIFIRMNVSSLPLFHSFAFHS